MDFLSDIRNLKNYHCLTSQISSNDDRQELWWKQRSERGFDDSAIGYCLVCMAKYHLLPRPYVTSLV